MKALTYAIHNVIPLSTVLAAWSLGAAVPPSLGTFKGGFFLYTDLIYLMLFFASDCRYNFRISALTGWRATNV